MQGDCKGYWARWVPESACLQSYVTLIDLKASDLCGIRMFYRPEASRLLRPDTPK